MSESALQLVIVSNRLPRVAYREEGTWRVRRGSGGLLTAMAPVLRDRGGVWIGWAGTTDEDDVDLDRLLSESESQEGYRLRPVTLTREERDGFYYGFANEIIWPLFHSLDERCNFRPAYWQAYEAVNRKFARAVAGHLLGQPSYTWVHDYHLMLVGRELRSLGVESRVAFYLHIPFPSLDMFLKLPWRFQVLRALLEYDMLGFQTLRDRANFVRCVRTLLPDTRVTGRGLTQTITTPTRATIAGVFPISIDSRQFAKEAAAAPVTDQVEMLRNSFGDRQVILGLDRLDYTKGVPNRLEAIRHLLRHHPELHERLTLVQIVVPSRIEIPAYQDLRERIEELVGEINGEFTRPGWVPIHYLFRSLEVTELLAYYRVASVALVTPLIDGMNLIAKEYCACNLDATGVLVLSEFAGAAAELESGALLVNPYDFEGVAEAICTALRMDRSERRERMSRLRRHVRRRDVFRWLDSFLATSIGRTLHDFPLIARYIPLEGDRTKSAPRQWVAPSLDAAVVGTALAGAALTAAPVGGPPGLVPIPVDPVARPAPSRG
jgi:trehalose 6-phosphate synthase